MIFSFQGRWPCSAHLHRQKAALLTILSGYTVIYGRGLQFMLIFLSWSIEEIPKSTHVPSILVSSVAKMLFAI